MAFRKLMARTGLFSSKGEKSESHDLSQTLDPEGVAARPLSINVDTASSPVAPIATPVPVSATSSKLRSPANRDWLANIRRIKSSEYYNRINDIVETLRIISKSEESEAKLTPSERNKSQDGESAQSPLSCLSPRLTGKEFEFLQQLSSDIISDYFTLSFGDGASQEVVSTDFFVTRDKNVVVVETEKSFKNAALFQKLYPEAAKSFGFMVVIWFDPEKQIEVARSEHPDWPRERLNSNRHPVA
jgi:hypothetical protein